MSSDSTFCGARIADTSSLRFLLIPITRGFGVMKLQTGRSSIGAVRATECMRTFSKNSWLGDRGDFSIWGAVWDFSSDLQLAIHAGMFVDAKFPQPLCGMPT
jgi:hypothetical protein